MPYKNYRLPELLEGAREGKGLTRQESIYLLDFDETSFESSLIRGTANALTRERLENSAVILGQIGLETDICTGGCRFCTFGNRDTQISSFRISDEVLRQKIEEFTINGDLYGLYLMTMHDYDMDRLLNAVRISKEVTPPQTQIWVNIGDSDLETYRILKNAGVQGAYHVNRLREGIDTNLSPKDRIRSMEHIIDAGLELYTCCEPIGPEHTNEELVENFFIGIDLGCTQHAVMKRIPVQNTPLAQLGQISEIRLAHIAAVVTLALGKAKSFKFMSIHEPNQVGLLSGANLITAESGANPRDISLDTDNHRGWTVERCRKLLRDSGFSSLMLGDESIISLNN
ncbi:MAG: radical SAM protein [Bacteroidetes bacterium]|nr:radical SAM protein [Bacteroidota bacterium]